MNTSGFGGIIFAKSEEDHGTVLCIRDSISNRIFTVIGDESSLTSLVSLGEEVWIKDGNIYLTDRFCREANERIPQLGNVVYHTACRLAVRGANRQ